MKILIVSQYFWPENFRINDLVRDLTSRGHEVSVLTGMPNYPEGSIHADFKRSPERYRDYHGAKVIRVPLIPRGKRSIQLMLNYLSFAISASLIGPFKLSGQQFDVIFCYEPSPITVGLPAIVMKWIKRAPLAFWVLDLWPESLSAVGAVKSPLILRMVGGLVRFIYRHCDLILAQSKSFISGIGRYCDDADKIKYFPSWSEDLFTDGPVTHAPELTRREDLFNVVFAGNIGDAQDFPCILKAAVLLRERRDIRWIIVGDGRMAAWAQDQIVQHGLHDTVVMTGRFALERMPSFFAHADALLVTLKANDIFAMTIPGKLQTYLSSGLPVVAALDGEGALVVTEAQAGYASDAGDAEGLAASVARMAGLSSAERESMGAAGKAYYEAQFAKKMLIDTLENDLRNLAESVLK